MSVINTYNNELFDTNQNTPEVDGIDLGNVIPLGSAISNDPYGTDVGRWIFQVDGYNGDLLWIDGSNFEIYRAIKLQSDNPDCKPLKAWGAYDIDQFGRYALVTHISSGLDPGCADPWNPNGGISIVDLNQGRVLDADDDPKTTSECAPEEGITRVEAPEFLQPFVPLGVKIEVKQKKIFYPDVQYHDGEKYPGVFGLVSGIGPSYRIELPPWCCKPGQPCEFPNIPCKYPPYTRRPAYILVIDLNEGLFYDDYECLDPNQFPPLENTCEEMCGNDYIWCGYIYTLQTCGSNNEGELWWVGCTAPNPDYKKVIQYLPLGVDGIKIKLTNSGIDYVEKGPGPVKSNYYSYALNLHENVAYVIKWDDWYDTFCLLAEDGECYFSDEKSPILKIPTGQSPTDVKVQKVEIRQGVFSTYAYITNALDDSVTVIDTATNTELPYPSSPIYQDLQCTELDHYPTSFDTRSIGDRGYSSDFHSDTVSVFNLPLSQMNQPICQIDVGGSPFRIVVQPHPYIKNVGYQIGEEILIADENYFTEPPKKSILINDWEHIEELQETKANPQAVLANIEKFQKNVNKWVKDEELKAKLDEDINMYKVLYISENLELMR